MFHSLDICQDIAHKLKDLEFPQEKPSFSNSPDGREIALSIGLPGIASFYAMMDLNFPKEGWDLCAHKYLKKVRSALETYQHPNLSLYSGLAGLALAVFLCSKNGIHYQHILAKLDNMIIEKVENVFLNQLEHYTNPEIPIPFSFYNLAEGLSGIVVYLIHRIENRDNLHFVCTCLEGIVKLLSQSKVHQGAAIPPWYDWNTKGCSLDVPYGLPGVLATLSLALKKGIEVVGLAPLINTLSQELMHAHILSMNRVNWNRTSPLKKASSPLSEVYEDVWLYGAPGVSRCLYLASQAIEDRELEAFSNTVFCSHFSSPDEQKATTNPSFCFGWAGLLALVYRMACDTERPLLFQVANAIEKQLIKNYSPLHPYGFQVLQYEDDARDTWGDDPSLLSGAAGIGLSLLAVQGRHPLTWSPIFAI